MSEPQLVHLTNIEPVTGPRISIAPLERTVFAAALAGKNCDSQHHKLVPVPARWVIWLAGPENPGSYDFRICCDGCIGTWVLRLYP